MHVNVSVDEISQTFGWISSFFSTDPPCSACPSAVCVIKKHAATLFAPGVPGVSRISASARSARTRPTPRCVEAMATPTTTSVNSACPPARTRGELMWRSPAAVMKVGNWLWNGVIMLTNHPLECCNYLYQLTCGTVFSHLWIFIMVEYATSGMPVVQHSKRWSQSHCACP